MTTSTLRLPVGRIDQAKAIAAHRGITVADVIGDLLDNEARRLGIANETTIADAYKLEDGSIGVSIAGVGTFTWTAADAAPVAAKLEGMATGSDTASVFDVDAGIEIARAGPAVRLRNIETGEKRTFSFSMAKTIARLIREAVAE